VLEGPHLVAEALDAGAVLEDVLVTPEFLRRPEGRELARRLAHPPVEVAPEVLASITDADSPRGVVAITPLPRDNLRALPRRTGAVYLFLDGVQDPGNLGALARTAEATGAAGLVLAPGSVHPNHPRALRASAGSLLRLPTVREVTTAALDRHLGPLSPTWVALVAHGGRSLYEDPLPDGTLVLTLGAEGPGLSAELEARSTCRITVPLETPVESLNVTVAAAVVLFELRRQCILALGKPTTPSTPTTAGSTENP